MDRGDVFGQAPCCVRAEYVLKLRPVLSEEAKKSSGFAKAKASTKRL